MKLATRSVIAPVLLFTASALSAQTAAPTVRWSFARANGAQPVSSTGVKGTLQGQYAYVAGLSGDALRFDGYTTSLSVASKDLPSVVGGFTVGAWVALNTYPWTHLPLVDAEKARQTGYCLEVDAFGHLAFSASIDGQWQTIRSTQTIALKHWARVAAVYTAQPGKSHLAAYLNGKEVAEATFAGSLTPAASDLLVGRVREPELPFPEAEIRPSQPITFSLDGLLCDLSLSSRSAGAEELAREYREAGAPSAPVLPFQPMPSGPAGPGRFGAYYTRLRYEQAWDALRRIDDDSDVVVRFDDSPNRLVFWQGLNYIPAWVSGDDKWYTDEFLEVWDAGCPDGGDCEPMSDKQEHFSHVNILESNDVRVVVHWRYALAEVVGEKGAWKNQRSGWSDWADEYWTVYPDGIAVRKQVLHSDHPDAVHEWQETIVLHQAGHRPEDDIAADAVTLGNMTGESKTYSWTPKVDATFANPQGPSGMSSLSEPNLQIVNTKSTWKPFQIVPPKGSTADFYNNEKSYFTFECWNHWPVAQIASSDRPCVSDDRPSHSSLSHLFWQPYAETSDTATKILMDGLTTAKMASLLPLARSWISPPRLEADGDNAVMTRYDATQRAYVLTPGAKGQPATLSMTLQASNDSPALNPAFLISNWGGSDVQVTIDGRPLRQGKELRVAHLPLLDRTDLLLWLPLQSEKPVHVSVSRAD